MKLQVLLISPTDPNHPVEYKYLTGGENTYTQTLLHFPPDGIEFTYFTQALKLGWISYHPLYHFLLFLQKIKLLPPGPRTYVFKVRKHFDLVYAHAHPIKIVGEKVPVVVSDSSSNIIFLTEYLKLSSLVIKLWYICKRFVFGGFGIIDCEVNLRGAQGFFVFSKWARHIKKEKFDLSNVEVIYPGLAQPRKKPAGHKRKIDIKFLFVGVWFERKGGRILLKVFRNLSKTYTNISLTILGELPPDIKIGKTEPITHKDFVSHSKLQYYFATHDVLVHVPIEVEGYGMTVVEAMANSMCVVVSDVCALPELVEDGDSGLVVKANSEVDLEKKLMRLIKSSQLRLNLGRTARRRFQAKFALRVFQHELRSIFVKAIK